MAQMIKLYRLPDEPRTKGIRQFRKEDCLQVAGLLSSYLARFKIAPQMTSEDIEHWSPSIPFLPFAFLHQVDASGWRCGCVRRRK